MTNTEIKKELYKQKPTAHFTHIKKGIAFYSARLLFDAERVQIETDVVELSFEIPTADMGEAAFYPSMEAKHLIRWSNNY